MIYKTYNCNSFNVHTIKTDKFKTCHMEIIFSKPCIKEQMCASTFLADFLSDSSKKYKSRKEIVIHLEELYKTSFYSVNTKVGNTINTAFILDFINPSYVEESNYLENVIKTPFEIIQKPNATNEEFDLKSFNIIKERLKREIEGIYENPAKMAFRDAFNTMDPDSSTSFPMLGTIEDLEKITPASLYKLYKTFFKDSICDIFIIGNLDMDEVVTLIKKYYKNRIINTGKRNIYIDNAIRKKEIYAEGEGDFIQANLVELFNLDNLTKKEKDVVFQVYNYLLGSGGLTSKLYQSIREENSLCYGISSMYLKYDGLLAIHVSLENENVKKASSLIKKCIKSMAKGEITEEELEDAKKNLILSLDLSMDNNVALINNYVFNIIDNLPDLEKRKEMLLEVTREDVINVAKKIKLNTVYVLNGGKK